MSRFVEIISESAGGAERRVKMPFDQFVTEVVEGGSQATLVSGTNIKTINGSSVLGSGDLVVGGALSAVLEADFSKTNDTLANVSDLTLTLEAGKWYRVTGQFVWDGGDGVGGFLDFAGGSATATGVNGGAVAGNPNGSTAVPVAITALTDTIGDSDFGKLAIVSFTVQVNAGGTLIPRFAQAVTDASASTLKKYSTIQAVDITPA